jgi:UDP-2-acetamido-2,6-beta-L-arabino-hexul-4-ose reductase
MKILVTGANGFIGKNLCLTLRQMPDIEVLPYDLGDEAKLDGYAAACDFVMHLAGVNRPKDPAEFKRGNTVFTEDILEKLAARPNPPPVLLSSSIQAALDNPYGLSKRAAEDAVRAYGEKTGAPVFIYRLANVFGKWCRPNYNSAVATWCHNIARDLPIQVRDPNAEVTLVYVDDVVKSFIGCVGILTQRGKEAEEQSVSAVKASSASPPLCVSALKNKNTPILSVSPSYTKTLGEIVGLIQSFHDEPKTLMVPDQKDGFTKKLYATYLSSLPEDQFSYPLTMHCDNRGSFTEALHSEERGQVSVNISHPGIVKGQHWHHTKHEKFLVVSGQGVIRFRKMVGEDKVIEYPVSGEKLEVVRIPPGYTHNIENTGEGDMVTLMWANEVFDPAVPDTFKEEV